MSVLVALALARTTLGGWDQWAAFRDDAPPRCYAIAAPVRRGPSRWEPFASVATWPRAGVRLQLHARLSRQVAPGSDTTASVGALRIPLVTNGVDAWTRGARDDAALATACRARGAPRAVRVDPCAADLGLVVQFDGERAAGVVRMA